MWPALNQIRLWRFEAAQSCISVLEELSLTELWIGNLRRVSSVHLEPVIFQTLSGSFHSKTHPTLRKETVCQRTRGLYLRLGNGGNDWLCISLRGAARLWYLERPMPEFGKYDFHLLRRLRLLNDLVWLTDF
jgi:hypothetical protein